MGDQAIGLSPALAAYAEAKERLRAPGNEASDPPAASFAAMLQNSLTDAVEDGRKGEAATLQAMAGGANLQDVVEAVNAAELSLQTVVAIRDRVISAYQDIIRMPI